MMAMIILMISSNEIVRVFVFVFVVVVVVGVLIERIAIGYAMNRL